MDINDRILAAKVLKREIELERERKGKYFQVKTNKKGEFEKK